MRSRALVTVLLLAGCTSSIDTEKGKFTCTVDADCGDGWECIKQAKGGSSKCFKKGVCVPEKCNGVDDNCDGVIDETFAAFHAVCSDAGVGRCATGLLECVDAGVVCIASLLPVAETCNGIDDNCNGATDETFDFTTDNLNCGACSRACGSGTTCKASVCRESNCSDGIDNDNDGGADCLDPACFQSPCFNAPDASYVCGRFPAPDAGPGDGGSDGGADGGSDGGSDAGDPDAGAPDAGTPDAGDVDAGMDAGSDAGTDAGVDAGPSFLCFPPEQCADGVDNDMDGLTDCADPDCNGRTCVSGTVCTNGICPGPG